MGVVKEIESMYFDMTSDLEWVRDESLPDVGYALQDRVNGHKYAAVMLLDDQYVKDIRGLMKDYGTSAAQMPAHPVGLVLHCRHPHGADRENINVFHVASKAKALTLIRAFVDAHLADGAEVNIPNLPTDGWF